jgi:hypothetical protein
VFSLKHLCFIYNQLKGFVKKKTPAVNTGATKTVGGKKIFLGTGFHGHGNSNT